MCRNEWSGEVSGEAHVGGETIVLRLQHTPRSDHASRVVRPPRIRNCTPPILALLLRALHRDRLIEFRCGRSSSSVMHSEKKKHKPFEKKLKWKTCEKKRETFVKKSLEKL